MDFGAAGGAYTHRIQNICYGPCRLVLSGRSFIYFFCISVLRYSFCHLPRCSYSQGLNVCFFCLPAANLDFCLRRLDDSVSTAAWFLNKIMPNLRKVHTLRRVFFYRRAKMGKTIAPLALENGGIS